MSSGFLKPSLDDDFFGSSWKEDKADLVSVELIFYVTFLRTVID
jgi:hypothetical protein